MQVSWWTVLLAAALTLGALWWTSRWAAEEAVRRFFRPPRRPPRPLPAVLQTQAEDVTIPGPLVPIKAWLLHPPTGPKGLAVFAHGWSSDGSRLSPMTIPLLEAGIACLLVDLPGHGRSPSVPTYNVVRLLQDLRAVRDWLAGRPELARLPAALIGYSFGGLGSLLTSGTDPRWDALVTLGTPVSPIDAIELYLKQLGLPAGLLRRLFFGAIHRVAGAEPGSLDIPRHLLDLRVPLLVVHGAEDDVVPPSHAERIASAAPAGLVTLAVVEGARHDGLMNHPAARERLREFLLRAFEPVSTRV